MPIANWFAIMIVIAVVIHSMNCFCTRLMLYDESVISTDKMKYTEAFGIQRGLLRIWLLFLQRYASCAVAPSYNINFARELLECRQGASVGVFPEKKRWPTMPSE